MAAKILKTYGELKTGDEFDIPTNHRRMKRVRVCSTVKHDRGITTFSIAPAAVGARQQSKQVKTPGVQQKFVSSALIEVYETKLIDDEMEFVLSFLKQNDRSLTSSHLSVAINQSGVRISKSKVLYLLQRAANVHKKVIVKCGQPFRFRLPLVFDQGLLLAKDSIASQGTFNGDLLCGWVEQVSVIQGKLTPIVRWENGLSQPVNEMMVEPIANDRLRRRVQAAKHRHEGGSGLPEGVTPVPWYLWSGLVKRAEQRGLRRTAEIDNESLKAIAIAVGIVGEEDRSPMTRLHPLWRSVNEYLDTYYPGWKTGKFDFDFVPQQTA